ncbi:succinylglutamate desuccinylase/aspartoacylase domain-containing protein [Ferrimonas pelagia]|uniref:Succinylglutamate desuccinylase/Aspartoacylase catalytic domain-containing protein n=1 Tax=Ferrimonas pelagia TaxID=1177826 RepID=A0ABP9FE07_9GAMM
MNMDRLHFVPLPEPAELERGLWHWLQQQPGPVWLTQPGRDPARHRVVITLLHGNEPSGSHGIWQWLQRQQQPAVTCHFALINLPAALADEGFVYRQLPDQPDLNRGFGAAGEATAIAHALESQLARLQPEAVIDLHNTSGSGPSFAVSTRNDPPHRALAALFSERMLYTEVTLGALMECSSHDSPIVTIECGGAVDPQSNVVAYEGLCRFASQAEILTETSGDWQLEVLRDPIRVELQSNSVIQYAEGGDPSADITLPPDIERMNFGWLSGGTQLGWLGRKGLKSLQLTQGTEQIPAERLFHQAGEALQLRHDSKLFMITTNPKIARSDCLFYAILSEG